MAGALEGLRECFMSTLFIHDNTPIHANGHTPHTRFRKNTLITPRTSLKHHLPKVAKTEKPKTPRGRGLLVLPLSLSYSHRIGHRLSHLRYPHRVATAASPRFAVGGGGGGCNCITAPAGDYPFVNCRLYVPAAEYFLTYTANSVRLTTPRTTAGARRAAQPRRRPVRRWQGGAAGRRPQLTLATHASGWYPLPRSFSRRWKLDQHSQLPSQRDWS